MEKKKRILLVTQYFYPENFKSNDIAFELQKRGYQVDALVGIPNYPEGEYYKGYGIFKKRIETINGVRVYRAFQTPRGRKAT
ncbi:MAG: glycosyltransferase WbuB, partial [Bacteroidaceae bacterium]|nr:glycosyltransferase WbuB [Bacteroidaceae bacterium]